MTIAEFRAVEVVAAFVPAISKALDRIADALDRIAAFARQADNQLPAASAEGTPTPTTDKE